MEISIVGVLGGGDDITALHYTASQFGAKPTEPTRYTSRAQVLAELDRFEAICSAWNPTLTAALKARHCPHPPLQ